MVNLLKVSREFLIFFNSSSMKVRNSIDCLEPLKKDLEKMNCEGPAKKETFESRISQKKVTVLLIFFLALCYNKPKKSFTFVKLMYLYT